MNGPSTPGYGPCSLTLSRPHGRRFEHHVIRLQRLTLAVLDEQDRALMMRQHRFATDEWGWELPGGIVDVGEDGVATAACEAEEETGWRPGPLEHLASFQPMPGMVNTSHEVYVARARRRSASRRTPRKPRGSSGRSSYRRRPIRGVGERRPAGPPDQRRTR